MSIYIIGFSVGSFLNVLIDRLPRLESVIKGRSYCDFCRNKLRWYDLIPILSFFALRGRCRSCKSPISIQYPIVEFLTGILFVATYQYVMQQVSSIQDIFHLPFIILALSLSNGFHLFFNLFIVSSLIVIFFTDLKYGIIPDKIVYPALVITVVYTLLAIPYALLSVILSAIVAFGIFFLLHFITRGRGMGFGDVKLAGLLGLFLGFPKIVIALYLAFLTGAFVSLILVVAGKKKFKGSTVPFGPFMVFGTLISLFYGEELVRIFLAYI